MKKGLPSGPPLFAGPKWPPVVCRSEHRNLVLAPSARHELVCRPHHGEACTQHRFFSLLLTRVGQAHRNVHKSLHNNLLATGRRACGNRSRPGMQARVVRTDRVLQHNRGLSEN